MFRYYVNCRYKVWKKVFSCVRQHRRLVQCAVLALVAVFCTIGTPKADMCDRAPQWDETNSLPFARCGVGAVAHNGWLYVVGGSYSDWVRAAPIDPSGSLGAWVNLTSLPKPCVHPAVIVWDDYLYVMGGYHALEGALYDVYSAPIDGDGTIGSWSSHADLPVGHIGEHSAFVRNWKVYLVSSGRVAPYTPRIQMAELGSGGDIGSWTVIDSLATERAEFVVSATYDHVYIIGGGLNETTTGLVERGEFAAGGMITNWTILDSLPVPIQTMATVSYLTTAGNHEIQLFGGWNWDLGSCPGLCTVWKASIDENGDLSKWWPIGSVPKPFLGATGVTYGSDIYVIGGDAGPWGAGEAYDDILRVRVDDMEPLTGVPESPVDTGNRTISIGPVMPNPFSRSSTVSFSLVRSGKVRLSVHDAAGRCVRVLREAAMPAGSHRIAWDGMDEVGHKVASGVYLFRLESGGETAGIKATLVR